MDKNEPKFLEISAEEMDYLSQKYEIRDIRDLFSWGVKLLYDLSKLQEDNWHLSVQKCTIDPETRELKYLNFNPIHLKLEWLGPVEGGFMRLPSSETLNKMQHRKG